jgi:5'-3' exonuclease
MGINGLHAFLKKKFPRLYREVGLDEYAGKRVAIDISGLIYKYKVVNPTKWLDSFAHLVFALRRCLVHPIFIFEGQAPPEKDEEKSKRAEQRQKLTERSANLRIALDQYHDTHEIDPLLEIEMKKIKGNPLGTVSIHALEKRQEQLESQLVHFSDSEKEDLLELFRLCGVQYLFAPAEAETLCCALALNGQVDAVVSNDSDVHAYGAPIFLYEINAFSQTCLEINHAEVLKETGMTQAQFLDFCIMCGTDYNKNIPRVGPVNSFTLMKKHVRIEDLPSHYDTSILNFGRVRELFTALPQVECSVLSLDPASLVDIFNFLKLKNSRVQFSTIEQTFSPPKIVFED